MFTLKLKFTDEGREVVAPDHGPRPTALTLWYYQEVVL
jgi:hypothetical protein